MHDLGDFSLRDVAECTARVRRLGLGAGSMEEAAGRIVNYLYEDLADQRGGQRACALVRFYKTHPYGLLDAGRRRFAAARFSGEPASPGAQCLALLAAAGHEPAPPSVIGPRGHQAIPFETARVPTMIRDVTQLGIDLHDAASTSPRAPDGAATSSGPDSVVHLLEAASSPAIPLQDAFLLQHRIRSVLGFGGLLPGGDLFVVVLFTRIAIGDAARDLFKTLALAVKVGVMSFERGPIFC
jgi:hypothetical protein